MRVKLEKEKQKELIYLVKKKKGITWAAFAKDLNVGKTTLKEWGSEKNLLPLKIFNKLDKDKVYRKFILEHKQENWGRSKGGMNSSGTTKQISFPEENENLAEFIGIVLGDGNINVYNKGKKSGTYMVKIAGDSKKDYEYLTNHIANLSKRLFDIEPKFYQSKNSNCFYVLLHGIKLVQYLSEKGLKDGNKIKNQATIPKWVWKEDSYLKACIKGLYDTDGSVYELLPHWPGLFQISFDNNNFTLLKDVRKALIKLGFIVSNISSGRKGAFKIYITRKEQIHKFYKEIGFSNPKHSRKLEKHFNSPEQPRGREKTLRNVVAKSI